jgi:HD-GYP domain-containing protein (c-di-GMP phosphodiesterase class II)
MTQLEKTVPDEQNAEQGLIAAENIAPKDSEGAASSTAGDNALSKPKLKDRINQALADYREWAGLPIKIRSALPRGLKELQNIHKTLTEYRMILLKFNYLATNVDSSVWEHYKSIFTEFKRLEKETNKYLLPLGTLTNLRILNQDWINLIEREADFIIEVNKAPSSLRFYDKMVRNKVYREKERRHDEELTQKFTKAYQSLENAMEYVEKFNSENDISVFGASVLRIEEARKHWEERLNYIHELEATKQDDPEIILAEINKLKDSMYAAPTLAKWVHEIEQRMQRIKFDHDLLVNTYGKAVIPNEAIEENATIISEIIPRLWANGQREQMDHYLRTVESYLTIYEPEVQSELTFAERHQMKRQVDSEAQDQSHQYKQLIDLTKILISAIESREPTMANHSLVVSRLCIATARQMNWAEPEIRSLEIAALLHDVGKIWIPESILAKESQLTEKEFDELKRHPLYGAQILESIDSFKEIAPWIYYHQERWDGTGYPEGLAGEEIPIASRIIAVAEAYNAMTSGHTMRKAITAQLALEEVEKESGKAFDPHVVEAFIKAVTQT